ncbi:Rieske (2Fe-2S) oxidoreductase [Candidatus Koribacter versatilis Ellin345]|uniref:Rieske (2Fe-2S) oxidoreductase n=1 Tax=Koribacter versatilis (strain Ellin345) TaxID=204669 RepID=Q1ILA2_KORVE|nr:Rieske (2Fe-2S) protein [Candidatus Koribacter versatilis]ABF42348.1 Rieske (2Fe-2S) oxidoreductase [Candidatus Koribacter versatilis Ellin345]
MSEFRKIAIVSELPPLGEGREFVVEQRTICIANENGKYVAMNNVCAHRGGPLGQGVVDEGKMVCPWHGWQFDLVTGKSEQSATLGVDVYELKIEGDDVLVKI